MDHARRTDDNGQPTTDAGRTTTGDRAADLLARIDRIVGPHMQEVERIFQREIESRHPYVAEVLAHVTRFRGKRLRPLLLLLSAEATGGITDEHHVLAAVVEMIHTATLVHDDVLDEATTRRHVATVNGRWNNETSVLLGDHLFTHAFHLASSLRSTLACRLIGRATNIVCEGELAQIHERGNFALDEAGYLRIIDAKTAELCALCCFLGAHFAGASEKTASRLEGYGRALGIAFQIADDMLDIVGTEEVAGKTLGSDFRKQKLTLPIIHLLRGSPPDQTARLHELLAHPDPANRATLARLLREGDAIDSARARARDFAAEATSRLEAIDDSPVRRLLCEMAQFAVERTS